VAYGSPTQLVRDILFEVVRDHPHTLPIPDPLVLFEDFADSSLNFRVYYWLTVGSEMDMYITASDLRYQIDQRFREAGVTIAFPQRDIHIDTTTPLQVAMQPSVAQTTLPTSPNGPKDKSGATKPTGNNVPSQPTPV
jgi:small-conductance mechanosensitive channel